VGRAAALLALAAALIAWEAVAPHLSGLSLWPSVAIVAAALMPAFFLGAWLALPLWSDRMLYATTAAMVALAIAFGVLGPGLVANLTRFGAMVTIGWSFLSVFEELSWVVAVALIIPWVDAYSVWRGPTHSITTHHASVFSALSVAFVVPGGGAARLGLPDIMFFAVFLAASVRFGLRPGLTWLGMTVSLGLTIVITTIWATNGLPALPGIALGFLLPNADLLWRRLARRGQTAPLTSED
jgi:hypothetical protein